MFSMILAMKTLKKINGVNMSKNETKELLKYLFEIGELKRVKRSGWWIAKIKDPESVAEHVYRTAVVAFVLAELELLDPRKLCSAAVFHDMVETRLLDLHKINSKYIDVSKETEKRILLDQVNVLPAAVKEEILLIYELSEKEKIVLRDADLLECALQAKEYIEIGYKDAEDWITNIEKLLKTKSAKALYAELKEIKSSGWWASLKKLK